MEIVLLEKYKKRRHRKTSKSTGNHERRIITNKRITRDIKQIL